jgi:hypothetical protein
LCYTPLKAKNSGERNMAQEKSFDMEEEFAGGFSFYPA